MEQQRAEQQQRGLRRSVSNLTVYLDFDIVAVLNVWIRHQKLDLGLGHVLFTTLLQIAVYILEFISLVAIIVALIISDDGESKIGEIISILLMRLITMALTTWLKISFQRNISVPDAFFSMQIGGLWNAVLLILKPLKYVRSFYHRNAKMSVLGKDFIHGEVVTSEQFQYVLRINREELVDARDDLHDAFIQRIPMALLQFYFFSSSPNSPRICSFTDGCRLLVVVLNLFTAIQSSLAFGWKREIYMDSLHIQSYLQTNGRYGVPTWTKDQTTYILHAISLSASILSRFFLISFMACITCGHAIACTLILFLSNWAVAALFPSVLATVENLPFGITLRASTLADRWVNTFCPVGSRFGELSKFPIRIGSASSRFPLVLTQMFTFMLAFALLYFFEELMQSARAKHSPAPISSNYTLNESICENVEQWPMLAQSVSESITAIFEFLNIICFYPSGQVFNSLHFHWILFYAHLIVTFGYNYYYSKILRAVSAEDFYPPIVSLLIFKQLFLKIFETRNVIKQINLLARLMFLMSLDLEHFNRLYNSYNRGEDPNDVGKGKWWDKKILHVVERFDTCRGRYRDNSSSMPNLNSLPVEVEIHGAYATIQQLPYSFRLYLLCGTRIDSSMTKEITSRRLEATIEMLEMSQNELSSALENSVVA